MTSILLLSGPNLDELGIRSPEIYGTTSLEQHVERSTALAQQHGFTVVHLQSNFEGELVEAIHAARGVHDAIIINPGALGHYSWSLRDALDAFPGTRIEVHLSNPAGREDFRRTSTLANVVNGTIAGFGSQSYDLAIEAVARLLSA